MELERTLRQRILKNITWGILNCQNARLRALPEFYCLPFVSIIKIPNMCMSLMNGQNSKISNR